jgi:multiple sugar transport system permease protein
LKKVGIVRGPIEWLTDPQFAMLSVLIVAVWKFYPIATLILLAGLQSIPDQLYEAASVDGAGYFERFWYITIPGVRYVSEVLILLLSIWGLRSFGIIWLLTEGGPFGTTNTLVINTYRHAFRYYDAGSATAMGLVIVVVCLLFTVAYFLLVMRRS